MICYKCGREIDVQFMTNNYIDCNVCGQTHTWDNSLKKWLPVYHNSAAGNPIIYNPGRI